MSRLPPKSKSLKAKYSKAIDLLYNLAMRAHRVDYKFGTDDDGKPSDWDEWKDLRRAITKANELLSKDHPDGSI